ncbi:MAG: hypothetical protein AAB401_14860 [Acidobacteriota bacterium]
MASQQFLHLLEQLQKSPQTNKLAWQPAKLSYSGKAAFRVALGEGVFRIEAKDDDTWMPCVTYRAELFTRNGDLVDELEVSQIYTNDQIELLQSLFHSAREAAFNLNRMVDSMQSDLESGRTRDLPPEPEDDDDGLLPVPF